MDKHVKIIGWLWIVNGVIGILFLIPGLVVVNWPGNVPNAGDVMLITLGSLCFFLPGIIADFVAGFGLLRFQNWARILAIILAIFNIMFVCYLIIPAVIGIYTLIIMFNQETVALFKGEVTSVEVEEVS